MALSPSEPRKANGLRRPPDDDGGGLWLSLASTAALTVITALAPAVAATPAGASGITVTSHFVVTNDADLSGDSAYLDNGATNFQPHAIMFMELNDTPGGVCGCAIVGKPLGVWYDASKNRWAVFTEDTSAMPASPSFNILVVQRPGKSVFVQHATSSNTVGNHTFINSSRPARSTTTLSA